jgi:hypothetical protein
MQSVCGHRSVLLVGHGSDARVIDHSAAPRQSKMAHDSIAARFAPWGGPFGTVTVAMVRVTIMNSLSTASPELTRILDQESSTVAARAAYHLAL